MFQKLIQLTFLSVFALASLTGCQQPGGSGRAPLVNLQQPPRLFEWGNRPAYTAANDTYRYNQQNGTFGWGFANRGQGNNNGGGNFGADPQQQQQFSNLSQQIQSLNSRLSRFDSDNQQLITELAAMKQKLQVANDYNFQLKQQLADTSTQMQQIQVDKSAVEQQLANSQFQLEQLGQNTQRLQQELATNQQQGTFSQASSPISSGATLRANNSLMQKLPQLQIPGAQARMDGDVIRVELPTDQLFNQGTYQINAAHSHLLKNMASAINQHFPRQIIGVEAHWDGTQIQPSNVTHHQVTASQSLAAVDYLTQIGLPQKQLFAMAMGSNRPRHPQGAVANGISPNRRIEIVIYPETYDGS